MDILRGFPTLKVLTLDQYGAFATVSRLREALRGIRFRARVREENFNVQSNYMRAERFKAGAGEGWIHVYRDTLGPNGTSLLEGELKSLRLKGKRLEKPNTGPVRSKDLADCVMVVAAELITDQLQRDPRRKQLASTPLVYGPGYRSRADGGITLDPEMLERG